MKANVGYRHDESRFTLPKTKMTALEYDNSFILDYNKNKKIFITGIKQDINLPKVCPIIICFLISVIRVFILS